MPAIDLPVYMRLPRSQKSRQSKRKGAPKLIKLLVMLAMKLLFPFGPGADAGTDLSRGVDECRRRREA